MSVKHPPSLFLLIATIVLFAITVNAQPSVIGHPADSSICVDASASFRVIALNTSAYQWQENDGVGWYNITVALGYATGFNTPLLSINDANLGLNGYQYRCVVFDADGLTAFSNPATLGVYDPPIIIDQPVDTRVCKNTTATFFVNALNGTHFGWQENIGAGWVYLDDNAFYQGVNTEVLEVFTTTGMNGFRYRCIIRNVSCPDTTTSVRLFVDPTPIVQQMTGGGNYCSGGSGVEIGLASSETGISYQLYRNTVATGIVREGNGSPVSFGLISQAGTYTVKGFNGFTGCEIDMEGQKIVGINPLPLQQQLMGGGAYCVGSLAPELYLSGSQVNVLYSLFRNGSEIGVQATGNGYVLSFGRFEEPGLYSVVATNMLTGCSMQIANQLQIIRNELPVANAGNNQTILRGNTASLTGTANSGQGSITYSWAPEAYLISPTSANTATIPLYQSRFFTLKVKNNNTTCLSLPDTVLVQITDGPFEASIIASQSHVCAGNAVDISVITSGGSGNYSFQWSSLPIGFTDQSASVTVYPGETTTYFVEVSDGQNIVNLATTVVVNPTPTVHNLVGGGAYCSGSEGSSISLSSSENGAVYKLFRDNQFVQEKAGTGQPILFGTFTIPGVYSVTATYSGSSCSINMNGTAVVSVSPLPTVVAGQNQYITLGNQTTLTASVNGGSGNYAFQWTPASLLINPGAQNPGTLPLFQTTLFEVQALDQQSGCYSSRAQTVVFVTGGNLSVDATASSNSVCPSSALQLEAVPTGGSGNYVYQWQSVPAGFTSNMRNPVVNPQLTTTYQLVVTDGFSVATDSVKVFVRPVPQAFSMTGGGSFCEGSQGVEVQLSGSETNVYYQLFRNGEETEIVRTGTAGPISFGIQTQNGVYESRAFSTINLCENDMTGSVNVVPNNRPTANAGSDRTILNGTSTNLNGQATGGSGNYGYSWTPANLVVNPSAQQSLTVPLYSTTFFYLHVTDVLSGCQSIADTVRVFVQGNTLTVDLTAVEPIICLGNETLLNAIASGGTGNYFYSWTSTPSGFYSTEQSPSVSPHIETTYHLSVYDGLNTVESSVTIEVLPLPQLFELNGGGSICHPSEQLQIGMAGSEFMADYHLYLNEELQATAVGTGNALSFGLFNEPGNYTVFAATSPGGCSLQMPGTVIIESVSTAIANAGPDRFLTAPGQVTLAGEIIGSSTAEFWWNPSAKLLNPDAIQPTTILLDQTTLFSLEVASDNCGGSSDYATVFVGGGDLNSQIIHTSPGCAGENLQLFALATGGSGNYTYLWISDPPGFTSTVYDPVATPSEPTKYVVFINDGNQVVSDSVFLEPFPNPAVFSFSGGGDFCGFNQQTELNLSGSQNAIAYTLFKNNMATNYIQTGTGEPLTFDIVANAGNFQVLAENLNTGCTSMMGGNVVVTVNEVPVVLASQDQSIQSGEITEISAVATGGSGSYQYFWTPQYLVESPSEPSTYTLPLESTTMFFVEVTDLESGCNALADTLIVYTFGGPLSARIISKTEQLCEGEPFEAYALAGGGTGNYTYLWSNESGLEIGNSQQLYYIPEESGLIYLFVGDGELSVNDSVEVTIEALPQLFSIFGGGSYCLSGEAPEIGLNGSEAGVNYTLYRNEQAIVTIVGQGLPIQFGSQPIQGSYTVEAKKPGFSCVQQMAGTAIVQQTDPPVANAGFDQQIISGNSASLQATVAQGSGSYTYFWNPASLVQQPTEPLTQTVELEYSVMFNVQVTDEETGCYADDQVLVFVRGGALQVEILAEKMQVCPGEQFTLIALPSGGTGEYQYQWSSNPSGFGSTASMATISISQDTWFYVELMDANETISDSILIQTYPLPQMFSVSGGGYWCENGQPPSVYLSDSEPNVSYKLYRNGLSSGVVRPGTGNAIDFGPQWSSGNYSALAISNFQCVQLMDGQTSISQVPKPARFNVLGGGDGCSNDLLSGVYLSGTQIGVHYDLLLNGMRIASETGTGSPVAFSFTAQSGVYTVEGTQTASGCASLMKGSVNMLVYPSPSISVSGEFEKCEGSDFVLFASGADQYIWQLDPVLSGNEVVFEAKNDVNLLVIGTNSLGCSDSVQLNLSVYEKPVAALLIDEELRLAEALPDGMQQYAFYSGSDLLQEGTAQQFNFGNIILENDSLYLVVVSTDGCESSAGYYVEPLNEVNAFSPNGDMINDVFLKGVFIRVYSRWGVELFAGNEGWDGTYNGVLVSPGTYYYVKELYDQKGNFLRAVKGSVTVVIE